MSTTKTYSRVRNSIRILLCCKASGTPMIELRKRVPIEGNRFYDVFNNLEKNGHVKSLYKERKIVYLTESGKAILELWNKIDTYIHVPTK